MSDTKTVYKKTQKSAFALGNYTQWFINTVFTSWLFSFYFAAVRLHILLILAAFVIYSFWNAFNDPMIGRISDKIRTKRFGRRKVFILIGFIPLTFLATLLFTPPAFFGVSTISMPGQIANFIYLLIIIMLYDTFYTMIALPYDSLFPELYTSVEERSQVNTYKQLFAGIGLICAFLVPAILVGDISILSGYFITGVVSSLIVLSSLVVSIKWGVKERKEFKQDHKAEFGFFEGLKYSLKNKGFILYTIMYLAYNYVLLVIGDIVPLFSKHIFGVENTLLVGILLGLLFIVGMGTVIIWKKLDVKIGSKKAFFYSILAYFVASIPLLFVWEFIGGLITVICMGFGFGGMLYFVYLIIADVVDEDELKTGYRREGTFFGVTNFFMRLAGVLSIVTIALVFQGFSWAEYNPNPGIDVIFGLRLLIFVFPSIALGIMVLCLYFYPFPKEKVEEIKKKIDKLHDEKLKRVEKI